MTRQGRTATIDNRLSGQFKVMISEHSLVVLDCDPDHEQLNRGDVGTVVHISKNEAAYEVEFVDGGGRRLR